MEEHI